MGAAQDTAYTARMLWRSPAFTTIAVLSLSVGIAGNAAIFSLADALLLRPLPGIANGERLVDVGRAQDGTGFDTMSYPNYVDIRNRNTVFAELAGFRAGGDALGFGSDDGAERVQGTAVSANYFSTLGVRMALGRSFRADEDRAGAPGAVTVISNSFWWRRFDADPAVVGQTVRLNGRPITIIGVAPPAFVGHSIWPSDLWIPLTLRSQILDVDSRLLTMREGAWMVAIGRLAPGVTLDQARSEMTRIAGDLEREYPAENRGRGIVVAPWATLPAQLRGTATGFVAVLFTLVGLILLIACTNVGAMLLARGVSRRREVAVRLALGAPRSRIVRLLITESVLIAAAGSVIGVAGALAVIRGLRSAVPLLPVAVAVDVRLDWRVIAFSIVLASAAGISAGLLPALEAVRTDDVRSSLRSEAFSAGNRRFRLRQTFVVTQLAMSLLLVVTALLFARSLANANSIDPGFVAEGVDVASLDLRLGGYDDARGLRFATELVARVEQLPAIRSAALSRVVPLTGNGFRPGGLRLPGRSSEARDIQADWNIVTPGYFDTLAIPLTSGRTFTAGDDAGSTDVAVVNETFARRVWPAQDPIGQQLLYAGSRGERLLEVIGVARDAKYRTLGENPRSFIYVPLAQHYVPVLSVMARSDSRTAITDVRALVRHMDPNLPLTQAGTLPEMTAFGLVPHRVAGWIAGTVGVLGLLLAAIGVYGITSYSVALRTREIGIRLALGAVRREVLLLIVSRAMTLAGIGSVIGLAIAALASQLLRSQWYGIDPIDPVAFAGGTLVLVSVGLVASFIPARRASKLNPVEAVRAE
jgi:predicted permease